jgi:S-adenosyl methyltransferase
MTDRPTWAPPGVDIDRPSVARIYDYNLGGSHNFAVDRAAAEQMALAMPMLPAANRANRSFLRRAVRTLTAAGIRQFLDLGSGIPTVGNVHEIARQAVPDARVVYVDVDPVAAAHGRALLADDPLAGAVLADLRNVHRVLADPLVTGLLDFSRPVGVLIVAALHFVPDADDPVGIVHRYGSATVPGSYLVISHPTDECDARDDVTELVKVSARNSVNATLRGRADVARMFEGYRLLDPGIVYTPEWRPEGDVEASEFGPDPSLSATLAAVGERVTPAS